MNKRIVNYFGNDVLVENKRIMISRYWELELKDLEDSRLIQIDKSANDRVRFVKNKSSGRVRLNSLAMKEISSPGRIFGRYTLNNVAALDWIAILVEDAVGERTFLSEKTKVIPENTGSFEFDISPNIFEYIKEKKYNLIVSFQATEDYALIEELDVRFKTYSEIDPKSVFDLKTATKRNDKFETEDKIAENLELKKVKGFGGILKGVRQARAENLKAEKISIGMLKKINKELSKNKQTSKQLLIDAEGVEVAVEQAMSAFTDAKSITSQVETSIPSSGAVNVINASVDYLSKLKSDIYRNAKKMDGAHRTDYYSFLLKSLKKVTDVEVLVEVHRTLTEIDLRNSGAMPYAGGPKVSVIMPAYNRENLIKIAIRSVLSQTYQNFELIICDDNSTDGTIKAVKSFSDQRISLLKHEENRGAASARNTALKESSGYIIAYLDSDNIWHPRYLETIDRKSTRLNSSH